MVSDVSMKRYVLLVVLCLFLTSSVSAAVIVFDQYETVATLEGDSLHVERQMALKNVGTNPIIPGELHFKLYQLDGNDKIAIHVEQLIATRDNGQTIPTKIVEKEEYTDIVIHIWDPLLPKFLYVFTVEYDVEFDPSGILFYEVQLPEEETTIPITRSTTSFVLPGSYHVTYAPDTLVEKEDGDVVVSWSSDRDSITGNAVVIEYSRVPFPRMGLKAVNIFWSLTIIILVLIFARGVMRSRKRLAEEL